MNYRHAYHAANFADVTKHVLLGLLLRGMSRKEKGFLYLDTHAGRGRYDLEAGSQGDSLAREPEWPLGLGRVLSRPEVPPAVADYLTAVREFDRRSGNLGSEIRFYPGSPWLARAWTRPQDRLALCELNPSESAALAAEFSREVGVGVQTVDGYAALRGLLPPPEKRALVLVDPPFEGLSEWEDVVQAIADGLRRLPGGTFVVWYPLTERARVDRFAEELLGIRPPPTWTAEVTVAGERAGLKMRGCGLAVVNPPWQLDREVTPILDWLAATLAQAPGGYGALSWLVPES